MKFKSDIEVQAGLRDGSNDIGTAGQLLSSTGTITNWIDQAEVVAAGATRVLIACKNTSGATITKGTPVYQTGNVGATDVIEVAAADALISTGYLPAIGLLETDLINNALGHVVITGELLNITTDPIDGLTPTTGDTIYLKSGGGLTLTKPTGEGNAIQNLGLVGKVSGGNAGSLTVASIMRQNDVPNLPTGKIWVGDGNTIVSDVIYLDETNDRVGINTTSPTASIHVVDNTTDDSVLITSTNTSSSAAPVVTLKRDSSSPADGDYLGQLKFKGENSASQEIVYAKITGKISDVTDTTEDGLIETAVKSGGSNLIVSRQTGTDLKLINGIGLQVDGDVGIGTTSPSYKLDVSGDAYIDETLNIETTISGALTYGYGGVGAGNLVVGGLNFASFTPGVITLINQDTTISPGQDLGVLQFGGKDDQTNGYANGQIICTTAAGAGSGNTGGGIFRFLLSGNTTGSSPTERMRITNTGNVGIGTTSPNEKLEVNGSVRVTGAGLDVGYGNNSNNFVQIGNGRTTNGFAFIDLVGDTTYSDYGLRLVRNNGGANTNSEIIHRGIGALNLNATQAGSITLKTSNVERVRVNSSGNVGIGTTNPGEKLEVNGSVKATASTDAYKGYIKQTIATIANEKAVGGSADYNLIPYNTLTTTTSNQYYNRMVAAYDGRIKKVYIRNTGGNTPTATVVNFKKQINNGTSGTVYSATVTGSGSGMSAYYDFANNDFTFNAGDTFGILYQTTDSGGGARTMGGVAINIIVEYNIT